MLDNFFQYGAPPGDQMTGSFDLWLVALSYLIASFASYIALELTARLRDPANNKLQVQLWWLGGSLAMGMGIWSMHFIGMLAFEMDMPMDYDPMWTFISMVVAVVASAIALFALKAKKLTWYQFIFAGIVLGIAIAAMHYTGMHAMTVSVKILYVPWIFWVSILIAIVVAEAALWLALRSNIVAAHLRLPFKLASALVMGAAICGMHYTGMAAAVFTHIEGSHAITEIGNGGTLSVSIAVITFLVLCMAIVISISQARKNRSALEMAREMGKAEVASNVLHSVGNALNSINISASLINSRLTSSRMSNLTLLSDLVKKNENNLGEFLTKDPQGKEIPRVMAALAKYCEDEKNFLKRECNELIGNIDHVKHIVSLQQNVGSHFGMSEVQSISDLIEESLVILGVKPGQGDVEIIKEYQSLHPVMIDKDKLKQIIVNLLKNALESLRESVISARKITISLSKIEENFRLCVLDNGPGIKKENMTRIFAHGFTTKKTGHGFGLHSCALLAKEMGGELVAQSEGEGKGAVFILTLPYKPTKVF